MATPNWQITGDFFGNCSCDYLRCPCPASNFTELPTQGWCKLAVVFHVERGQFENVNLDGCNVIMVADIPGAMADGNWAIGLIFDEQTTPEQQQALGTILGGQAGGPMANFAPWVSKFLGAETRPIQVQKNGMHYSFSVPGMIDYVTEGVPGANPDEPVYLDNVYHPANSRVALAKGVRSHLHAFGVDWDGIDSRSFGVFTSFNWQVS